MLKKQFSPAIRKNVVIEHNVDLAVTGGGLAGVCAAISAARKGLKVVLVQDRPVLGGNASSEVRLWSLGATSHLGNNNRYSREGGIIDELMVENLFRNPEGNTLILDTILLEKVLDEKNITLLLNTSVFELKKNGDNTIESIAAFCSQNSTQYTIFAKDFCDASGDGIISFLSGASFRIGAESKLEFDEGLAPDKEETELLGHSIYFYSKDVGRPVEYHAPNFAGIEKITMDRVKRIRSHDVGPRLWWIEFGGNLDTIYESEEIKFELWKVVYGLWDYIKNSGKFENVENLTLEWVGTIPGKRESRRFEGMTMLTQQDIVEQRDKFDAISYGGWAIDHHPGDGVYSDRPPCTQYHAKGTYHIPLRSFITDKIDNLFFVGRLISSSHIAFGSTRVMCTCAHGGQAIGQAVALKQQLGLQKNTELINNRFVSELQQNLLVEGHFIPGVNIASETNLFTDAECTASSTLILDSLIPNNEWRSLDVAAGQMLPLQANTNYSFTLFIEALEDTDICIELKVSRLKRNFTPDVLIHSDAQHLKKGKHEIKFTCEKQLDAEQYAFLIVRKNPKLKICLSDQRITGVVSVFNGKNKAVSNNGEQKCDDNIGIDSFEFWTPERRPGGKNLAFGVNPPLDCFTAKNLTNGYTRPHENPNAWVAHSTVASAELVFDFKESKTIKEFYIHFDTDFDHPLESSLMGHPEKQIPFCVQDFSIYDDSGNLLHEEKHNHQSVRHIRLDQERHGNRFRFVFNRTKRNYPIAIFEIIAR